MTLDIITKSHGSIESGFYMSFTKLFRMGKYAFETKDLCGLAKILAENPEIKELKICGYDVKKFWQLEEEYEKPQHHKYIAAVINNDDKEFDDFVFKNRELSAEDKAKSINSLMTLPVKINYRDKAIKIGEYEIEKGHFICFINYILNGGFCGWLNKEKPDFVEEALIAINTSKNPLFKR